MHLHVHRAIRLRLPGICAALLAADDAPPPVAAALEPNDRRPVPVEIKVPPGHRLITVVVDDANGVRVRNLLAMQPVERFGGNPASSETQRLSLTWDGTDDDGAAAPAGLYMVRGLSLPGLRASFERSFYNPGAPPWHGYPNSHWAANHGDAVALACVPPGDTSTWRTVIACAMSEGTDFMFAVGKDDRKVMGWQEAWGNSQAVAIDGKTLYAAFANNLKRLEVGTGRSLGWQRTAGTVPDNRFDSAIYSIGVGLTNLAVVLNRSEKLRRPVMVILDKATGRPKATNELERCHRLAVGPDDVLYGTADDASGMKRFSWDGSAAPYALEGVARPGPLTFDAGGNLCIMDAGPDRQVKVFSPKGHPVRTIGKRGGGRDGYRYDRGGLIDVLALAVDDRGFLWTSEGGCPRRQAVWDKDGNLVTEFVGSTHYGAMNTTLHDQDPDRAFVEYVGLRSDPAAAQDYRVDRFVYSGARTNSTFALENGLPWAFFPRFQYFRSNVSGRPREYLVQTSTGYPVIYVQEGDGDYRPRAAMWTKTEQPACTPWSRPGDPVGTVYIWSDRNGDERIQDDEVTTPPGAIGSGCGWAFPMPLGLELYNGGYAFRPTAFAVDGAPVYGSDGAVRLESRGFDRVAAALQQPPGAPQKPALFYQRIGDHLFGSLGDWPTYFSGKHLWMDLQGNVIATWRFKGSAVHGSMALPSPLPDGETLGELFISGVAPVPSLGAVMAMHGNYGQAFLFTEDGLFVSSLFRDRRSNPDGYGERIERGKDWTNVTMGQEAFCGWFGRHTDGTYRYVFGHTSANVVQIHGLEDVRVFKGNPLRLE